MDKKGFILGKALKIKAIARRGRRNPRYTQDGTREMVTVVECVGADGCVLPPLYIYKGGSQTMGWHTTVQPDDRTTFAWSLRGLTDNELGLEWVEKNFDRFTKDR
jgi:hypothetical protein